MKDVIIIGGGPSGILCALTIKENAKEDVNVIILERLEKIGKKLLATGNGKCNFTNKYVSPEKYNNQDFVTPSLEKFSSKDLISYLGEIGLFSKEGTEGRIYPYSESANTVLDILRLRLNKFGIVIKNNYEASKVVYKNNKYLVYNKNQRNYYLECDYLVFACGGSSAPILGSNGSGYALVKPYKVKVSNLTPGLVGLKSDMPYLKALNGLRVKASVNVIGKKSKKCVYSSSGEVQFKVDGISGIVVMEASSFIGHNPGSYYLELDFMKDVTTTNLIKMLEGRKNIFADLEVNHFLTGILLKMIGSVVIKKTAIDLNGYVRDLKKTDITKIVTMIKKFPLEIKGDYGFERSQVTIGGVELNEIDPKTLKIKKMKNAYICGEMMDIDGECGGYNLQWAMSSGYIVGNSISVKVNEDAEN